MKFHLDIDEFVEAINASGKNLNINPLFIEKDYWITLVLKHLAESKYAQSVVFKGGTSLSKAYRIVDRFSEDIDIAVINASEMTGNQVKTLIRNVEKKITTDLTEIETPNITRKGSKFRKSVFSYPGISDLGISSGISDRMIIEINFFANPYPYEQVQVQSFIGEYLESAGFTDLVSKYGLGSFGLNVLNKKRTMLEKIVSLIRFSFDKDPVASLSGKIRYFYDIYFLLNDPDCSNYINSAEFKTDFADLIEHDKSEFDEPEGWKEKGISDSPLISNFSNIWIRLKGVYINELSLLAFTEIPDKKVVEDSFAQLVSTISD